MRAEIDKIVSLSDGDSTAELQTYLSSLKNDQVITVNDQVYKSDLELKISLAILISLLSAF